ncbi:MAG: hypothetical protein ACLRVN_03370 [Butyricicoccus sp.]
MEPVAAAARRGKINIGAHTNIVERERRARGQRARHSLRGQMTAILAAKEPTISVIREQAAKLNGAPIKVKVREAGEELVVKKNIAVDELIDRAKSMDIQVKQL